MGESDNNYREDPIMESWPVLDGPERAREADQLKLMTGWLIRTADLPEMTRLSPRIVKIFLQFCDLAGIFQRIANEDSVFRGIDSLDRLQYKSAESLHDYFESLLRPTPVRKIPGISEISKIIASLKNYPLNGIDESTILALDDACEKVWRQNELESRCLSELETTDDAVQRAKLYLEIDRISDAYREYMRISPDEVKNPENTLDLVDLVEQFEEKSQALHLLKRWLLFEITLHPLSFDLVSDILFSRPLSRSTTRIRFLRSTLVIAPEITIEQIHQNMMLVIPGDSEFRIDIPMVEKRLKIFNISLEEQDIYLDDNEPICLHTHLTDINNQLNHMGDLAVGANRKKLALAILERSVMCCVIRLFMPPRREDIQQVFGYGQYNSGHGLIIEDLKDITSILESIEPDTNAEKKAFDRLWDQMETMRILTGKITQDSTFRSANN